MTEYFAQTGHWGVFSLIILIAGVMIVPSWLADYARKLRIASPSTSINKKRSLILLYGIVFVVSYIELLVSGLLHYSTIDGLGGLCAWMIANVLLVSSAVDSIDKKGEYAPEPLHIGIVSSLAAIVLFTVFIFLGLWSAMSFTAMTLFPLTMLVNNRNVIAKDIERLRRWVNREKSQ